MQAQDCKTVVWYHVRDILAYDQFVFVRRDELQNSASTAVCNQKGLMGEIHAYMGIGLSTHNIQNAQRGKQLGSEHIE